MIVDLPARSRHPSCAMAEAQPAAPAEVVPDGAEPVAGEGALPKVMITGSTGYLGRFLMARMSEGNDVTGVSRSSDPRSLDLEDADACEAFLQDLRPDVIVHAAALSNPGECEKNPDRAEAANVPRGFLEAAARLSPPPRLILTSTDQVLDGTGHCVPEEESPNPVNVYGRTKAALEDLVKELFPHYAILRLSFIYGPTVPGAHSTFLQFALDKLKAGAPFTAFSDQVRSSVYIVDVVEAVRRAAMGECAGVVNVGGPEPLSRYDFCRIVGEVCGMSTEQMGQERYADLSGMIPSPPDISMNVERLTAVLGRSPMSLAEALADMGLSA